MSEKKYLDTAGLQHFKEGLDGIYSKNKITVSFDAPSTSAVNDIGYEDLSFRGLTLTANIAGSTVTLTKVGSPSWSGYYSIDGSTWISYVPGTTGAITLTNAGDKVYFKGTQMKEYGVQDFLMFTMTGSIAASGNCMSMGCGDNFITAITIPYNYAGHCLFFNCVALTTPPTLPSTTLTTSCYSAMFRNCTNLTTLPALPATTLSVGCYAQMFDGCTSLYVSDSPISDIAEQAGTLPTSGLFKNTYTFSVPFRNCLGSRSSANLEVKAGSSKTYYTQNTPV